LMACIKLMGIESRWVCFICCFMCACGVWDHVDGKVVLYLLLLLCLVLGSHYYFWLFFLSWFLGFFFNPIP
jgi:hypothetical protein